MAELNAHSSEQLRQLDATVDELARKAAEYLSEGNLIAAEQSLRSLLDVHGALGYKMAAANTLEVLADIQLRQSRFPEAEESFRCALQVRFENEPQPDHKEKVLALFIALGATLLCMGNYSDAETALREALDWEEMVKNAEAKAAIHGNLALVRMKTGHFDQAEKSLREVLALHCDAQDTRGTGIDYMNLALVEHQRGNPGNARGLWTKSLEIFQVLAEPKMVERIQSFIDAPPKPDAAIEIAYFAN